MTTPAKCGAKTRKGGLCGQAAGWGTDHPRVGRCKLHGGSTQNHVVAAARIAANAEAQRMMARAGVDADPLEHLLESLHRAAALVEVWGQMVAAIDERAGEEASDRGHLRGELGYEEVPHDHGVDVVVMPRDRLMAVNSKGEARVHPYVVEYQSALERRAKFAKLCIDAGIAERQVELAEEQGKLIAKVISAVLSDLDVSETPKVRKIVGRHLRLAHSA